NFQVRAPDRHCASQSASVWPLAYLLLPQSPLIASEPLAKGIQDNSFFIEEAYNQEPGVVQHILNVPIDFTNGSREIAPSFTRKSSTRRHPAVWPRGGGSGKG